MKGGVTVASIRGQHESLKQSDVLSGAADNVIAEFGSLSQPSMHGMPDGIKLCEQPKEAATSIFGTMHALARMERTENQQTAFRDGIIQWSVAYAVAYALILTIAFALLVAVPRLEDPGDWRFWRVDSTAVDTTVNCFFYLFCSFAAMDSAWGMLLCAEWGVRAVAVPPRLFEQFVANLSPVKDGNNAMWVFRCFEPRAVHAGLPRRGIFSSHGNGVGFVRSASWDPFYFIDRSVQSLFVCTICLAYLNGGLMPAGCCLLSSVLLFFRIQNHGTAMVNSLFALLAAHADTVAPALGPATPSKQFDTPIPQDLGRSPTALA